MPTTETASTRTVGPYAAMRVIRRWYAIKNRRPGWTQWASDHCSTPQEKWDDQIRLDRAYVQGRRRWLPLARWSDSWFLTSFGQRIIDDTACTLAIAERMKACPNNPRHGGDGYDRHAGGTDRRTEYVSQGHHLIVRYSLSDPREWRVELLDDTPQAYAALQRLRDDFGHDTSITVA